MLVFLITLISLFSGLAIGVAIGWEIAWRTYEEKTEQSRNALIMAEQWGG